MIKPNAFIPIWVLLFVIFAVAMATHAVQLSQKRAPYAAVAPVVSHGAQLSPMPNPVPPPAPNIPKGPFTRPDCATYRNAQHPGCCPDGTVETGDFTGQPICAPPGVVF